LVVRLAGGFTVALVVQQNPVITADRRIYDMVRKSDRSVHMESLRL
jgi:hypothetical protein